MRRADYSELAGTYDAYRRPLDESRDVWLQALIRLGRLDSPSDILEVGCGTGRWTIPLAQKHRVFGLDPFAEMIHEARQKDGAEHVNWVLGAAPHLPFPSESFDRVLFVLVLQHINGIEETFRETHRVLRTGGLVLIRTCAHDYIRQYPLGDFFPGYRDLELAAFPETEALRRTLADIGFKEVQSEDVSQTVTHPAAEYLEKVRNRFISTLYRIGKENFRTGFERLAAELKDKESITYTIEHEHITAEKT